MLSEGILETLNGCYKVVTTLQQDGKFYHIAISAVVNKHLHERAVTSVHVRMCK